MSQQRVVKAIPQIRKRTLVPFTTPLPSTVGESPRVAARLLFPDNYNIKSSQFFQSSRMSKSSFCVLDLRQLTQTLDPLISTVHCDSGGAFAYLNFADIHGIYKNSAVIFADGTLVTWYMDKESEMQLASDIISSHSKLSGRQTHAKESAISNIFSGLDWSETISLTQTVSPATSKLINDGEGLSLTENDSNRSNEMLAISMALASAARMNVIESQLQEHIDAGHAEISRLLRSMSSWKLSRVSETIFESEQLVHNWRLFLSKHGLDDIPDSLWDYEALDRLYEHIIGSYDVRKRFHDVNTDLTYYSEFLSTCGEHVRHKYSSRLEKIIIIIIAIEAGIAMRHLILDLLGPNSSDDSADLLPVTKI
jgi:uncharacterized Rmd1/YagE family protein